MGLHYVNGNLVEAGVLDPMKPQIVIYEPMPDGSLKLIGADYLVLAETWHAKHTEMPQMMGQLFHLFDAPNRFGLPAFYTLHVWAWKDNPNGAFVNWHPERLLRRLRRPESLIPANLAPSIGAATVRERRAPVERVSTLPTLAPLSEPRNLSAALGGKMGLAALREEAKVAMPWNVQAPGSPAPAVRRLMSYVRPRLISGRAKVLRRRVIPHLRGLHKPIAGSMLHRARSRLRDVR